MEKDPRGHAATLQAQTVRDNMQQQTTTQVSGYEIAAVLRQVGRGEIAVKLVDSGWPWNRVYAGNVAFEIAGYRLVIFNDCDELDYIDSVVTPDDRVGDFEEWYINGEEPVSLLTEAEQQAIVARLRVVVR